MSMVRFLFAALTILIGLQPVRMHAADMAADPAVRQIESFYAALLDTMKRGEQLGLQGRHLKLTPITEEIFDLAAMAQLSVGPSWQSLSESEKQEIVGAKLLSSDRSSVPFNYRMHLVGDKWKIVDIYLNGYVSQLALRRADFSSTITNSGAAGLVRKINDMVDKQMTGS